VYACHLARLRISPADDAIVFLNDLHLVGHWQYRLGVQIHELEGASSDVLNALISEI